MFIKDKAGRVIDFEWKENIDKPNRGFELHEMSAYHEGSKVGYLKIEYVPRQNIKTFLPTIFHYAHSFSGHWLSEKLFDETTKQARNIDFLCMVEIIERTSRILYTDLSGINTVPDLEKALNKYYSWKNLKKGWKRFNDFQVDKPRPAYSHVTPFYLNSGIGALLYAATCQELKKKNLKLYASGLQSDSAKKLWEKFEEKDCVTYVKDRKYVDLPSPEHLFS